MPGFSLIGIRRLLAKALGLAGATAGASQPWLLLAARLWLAQAFLAAQVSMLMSGQSPAAALHGAWWAETAARVAGSGAGGLVQGLCPILLAAGLFARPAAGAMLLQTLILRTPGTHAGIGVFWVLLLLGLGVFGPGALSLDRLLRPAARSAALPGLRAVLALYGQVTHWAAAPYLLALRLIVALTLLTPHHTIVHGMGLHGMSPMAAHLPPVPGMIAGLPASLAAAGALLLAGGLGVRVVALAMLLLTPLDVATTATGEHLYWLLLIGMLFAEGGGAVALDRALFAALRAMRAPPDSADLPHVVIVGGGFAGIAAARGLRGAPCRVTLIDRHNYHLFQPLLYQVATAGLSPGDIATPIRSMLRTSANLRVLLGEVTGVDAAGQSVRLGERTIGYDWLVLATGAQHSYFGRDEWGAFAPGLKTIDDATSVRRRLLLAFEAAEAEETASARDAWLTFVIIGGGPTGVELAGAIAELARFGMEGEFRSIDPAQARVVLVQSGPVLLPTFAKPLSLAAAKSLQALGVEVRLNAKAEQIDAQGVSINGDILPARTVLWAAGVMASPAAAWLGAAADRAGRIEVGPDLRVAGAREVFAVGDTALSLAWNGGPAPGLAPAAKQGGAYAAQAIRASLRGKPAPSPFRYRHFGSLATIGRRAAVAEFGRVRVSGAPAWWLWGAAHILFLVGGRNRIGVMLEWLWAYLTFRRGTRLITGGTGNLSS